MKENKRFYYKSLLIRRTEEEIELLFNKGLLRGTTHGCIGQEAIPVVLSDLLNLEEDFVLGGHRSHGLALAFSDDVIGLLGELMGKTSGYVNGRGGSQHIAYKNLFTNGITGGMVPVATGLAFECKVSSNNKIATVCFGDGALNEGYVLESLNLASVLNLPLLFILENNSFAMSTPSSHFIGGQIRTKINGFGLKYYKCITTDIVKIHGIMREAISYVRQNRQPAFIECSTHRFSGHSKSDKRLYVPKQMDEYWEKNDFLIKLENSIDKETLRDIQKKVDLKIQNAVKVVIEHEEK